MTTTLPSATVVRILLALSVIVVLAHVGGTLARRIGQPRVVGEIAGGLAIGALPATWLAPVLSDPLPVFLRGLSTVGLVLFMFLVGVELELPRASRGWRGPALAAGGSVLAPFGLGVAVATTLPAPHGRSVQFVLFLGVSLAVTAFPVLARILRDRVKGSREVGRIAMAVAAVADVLAWLLLIVVLTVGGLGGTAPLSLLLLAPYGAVLVAVRRIARRRCDRVTSTPAGLACVVAGLAASAAFTEWLGLHAIIGAFAFGAALPTDRVRALREKLPHAIEPLVGSLLLPPFFVLSGMHADLSAVATVGVPTVLTILAVAVVGKAGGTALGARLGGFDAMTSAKLATLMNTRGLTELVVLDIGRRSGLLEPGLYGVLVLAAFVTTAMTTPTLAALDRWQRARSTRSGIVSTTDYRYDGLSLEQT